jgi:hypothetical protein
MNLDSVFIVLDVVLVNSSTKAFLGRQASSLGVMSPGFLAASLLLENIAITVAFVGSAESVTGIQEFAVPYCLFASMNELAYVKYVALAACQVATKLINHSALLSDAHNTFTIACGALLRAH